MEAEARQNRMALERICSLGQVAAWAMVALGVTASLAYAYAHIVAKVGPPFGLYRTVVPLGEALWGLAVLSTAHFIRFVVDRDAELRWPLRKGHIILGALALFLLLTGIEQNWISMRTLYQGFWTGYSGQMTPIGRAAGAACAMLMYLLPPVVKSLCVLGAAAMLRSVLPIIAESKTLA